MTKVGVVGLGKLGLPLACVLAEWGHQVTGMDSDRDRIGLLLDGTLEVQEPGVNELLAKHRRRLAFTWDAAYLSDCEVVFVVTPTPSGADGAFSLEYVEQAVASLSLRPDALLVVVSTVMPGHMSRLRELVNCGLCYQPQFIALGSVVSDMLDPDFVLIGADRLEDGERLAGFYVDFHEMMILTDFISAEIAKLALNCYVTMKISFANTLGELCERLGANALAVTDAIGYDRRIGHAYLRPGTAYGGPCFPRDNAAFSYAAQQAGMKPLLAEATHWVNRGQTDRLVEKVLATGSQRVAVLGLAYKPGTGVVEESAGVKLVTELADRKIIVRAHDPLAAPGDLGEIVSWAGCVVIATPWPEYRDLDLAGRYLIDPWGLYGDV